MRGNILLTNVYNFHNLGEVAQIRALLQSLPDCRFTVSGLYSFVDPGVCKELGIEVAGAPLKMSKVFFVRHVAGLFVRATLWRVARRPKRPHGLLGAYRDCDVVVDLGGDTFSDDPSPIYTLVHSVGLLLALVMGKPYVISSQSVGPFRTPLTRMLARFLLNRAAAVTARGQFTNRYLVNDLRIKNVREVADLSFLLQPERQEARGIVGINPSETIRHWMFPGYNDEEKGLAHTSLMAGLARELGQKRRVRLIPHVRGPSHGLGKVSNPDDRVAIREIQAEAPGAEAVDGDAGIGEINRMIGECDLFIGARMHACIAALTAGVPTVAITYSTKGKDLLGRFINPSLEQVSVNGKTPHQVFAEVMGAVDRLSGRARQTDGLVDDLRLRARGNIEAITEVYAASSARLLGQHLACYTGRSTDDAIWLRSASGGCATTLLLEALRSGTVGKVMVVKGDGLSPSVVCTDDEEEVKACAGSVYAPPMELAKAVKATFVPGETYAVVGLPCQIRALRTMEERYVWLRQAVRLHIGLFCAHAVESAGVDFLLEAQGIRNVASLRYRGKVDGMTGMVAEAEGRRLFLPSSRYWGRFFNFFFIPRACFGCRDLCNEMADISLGDAWGIAEGRNVIITRSQEGEELLKRCGSLAIDWVSSSEVVGSQRFFLRLKKGRNGPALATYRVARCLGRFASGSTALRPLLRLWVRVLVGKGVAL